MLLGFCIYWSSLSKPYFLVGVELEEMRLVGVTVEGDQFYNMTTISTTRVGGGATSMPFSIPLPLVDEVTELTIGGNIDLSFVSEAFYPGTILYASVNYTHLVLLMNISQFH